MNQDDFNKQVQIVVSQLQSKKTSPDVIKQAVQMMYNDYSKSQSNQAAPQPTPEAAPTPSAAPQDTSLIPGSKTVENISNAQNEDLWSGAQRNAQETGAFFPVEAGDNPLTSAAKGVGNLLTTSPVNLAKGIGNMVAHPLDTAYAIWRDPLLLNPVINEAAQGLGGAANLAIQGEGKKSLQKVGTTATNIAARVLDDPLAAFISFKLGKLNIPTSAAEVGDLTSGVAQKVSQGATAVSEKGLVPAATEGITNLVKGQIIDPIASFWDAGKSFFTGAKAQLEGVARVKTMEAENTMRQLSQIDDMMSKMPQYGDQYNQLVSEKTRLQGELQANIDGARRNADQILKDRQGQLTQQGDTKTGLDAMRDYWKQVHNDAQSLYRDNMVDANGNQIPVPVDQVISSFDNVLAKAKAFGRGQDFESLLDARGNLMLRKLWSETGSWDNESLLKMKDQLSAIQQKDIFTKTKDGFTVNPNGLRLYETGTSANDVSGVIKSFEEGLKDPSIAKFFAGEKNPDGTYAWEGPRRAFINARDEAIASTGGSDKLANVKYADELWSDYLHSKTPNSPGEVYSNWKGYADTQPNDVLDVFKNSKAAEIIRGGFGSKGNFDPARFNTLLDQGREVLGDSLYGELKGMGNLYNYEGVLRGKLAPEISPEAAQAAQEHNARMAEVDQKLAQVETAQGVTADKSTMAKNIDRIDTVDKLNTLADQAGIEPTDLGNWKLNKEWADINAQPGMAGKPFDMNRLQTFLDRVDSWGGKAGERESVQGAALGPEAQQTLSLVRDANEAYKMSKSIEAQGVLKRIAQIGLGGILYFRGFSRFIGAKYVVSGAIPDQPVSLLDGREIGILKEKSPGFMSKFGGYLVKAGFVGSAPSWNEYKQGASDMNGGSISPEDEKNLQSQYESNIQ